MHYQYLAVGNITGANANGTLYYSTDGGTTWAAVGAVSETSARVLFADASTRLYFQPNANYHGSIADAITFKAWDRTGGHANGAGGVDTTAGVLTPFSSISDTASLTVTAVADTPSVTGASTSAASPAISRSSARSA